MAGNRHIHVVVGNSPLARVARHIIPQFPILQQIALMPESDKLWFWLTRHPETFVTLIIEPHTRNRLFRNPTSRHSTFRDTSNIHQDLRTQGTRPLLDQLFHAI